MNPINLRGSSPLRRCIATALFLCHVYPAKALSPLDAKGWSFIDPPDSQEKTDYTYLNISHGFAFRYSGLLSNVIMLESSFDNDLEEKSDTDNNNKKTNNNKKKKVSGDNSGFLPDSYRAWARSIFKQDGGDYVPSTGGSRISPYLNPHLIGELIGIYMTKMATVVKMTPEVNTALFKEVLLKDQGFLAVLEEQRKNYCNNDEFRLGAFLPVKAHKLTTGQEQTYGLMKGGDKEKLCKKGKSNNYTFDLETLSEETKVLNKKGEHSFFNKAFLYNIRQFLKMFEYDPKKSPDLMVIRTLQAMASFKMPARKEILDYYKGLEQGIGAYENKSKGEQWLNQKNYTKPDKVLLDIEIFPKEFNSKSWLDDGWLKKELKALLDDNYSMVKEINKLFPVPEKNASKPELRNDVTKLNTKSDLKNNKNIQAAYDKMLAAKLYMEDKDLLVFSTKNATVSEQSFPDCAETAYLNFLKNAFLKKSSVTENHNEDQESKEDDNEDVVEETYVFAVDEMKDLGASKEFLNFFAGEYPLQKLNKSYKTDQVYRNKFAELVSNLPGVKYGHTRKKFEVEPLSKNFLNVMQETLFKELKENRPKDWEEVRKMLLSKLGGYGFDMDIENLEDYLTFKSMGKQFMWNFSCIHSAVTKMSESLKFDSQDTNTMNLDTLFNDMPELGLPSAIIGHLQDAKWSNQLQWVELFKLFHANLSLAGGFDVANAEYINKSREKKAPSALYLMQRLDESERIMWMLLYLFDNRVENKRLMESLMRAMEYNYARSRRLAGALFRAENMRLYEDTNTSPRDYYKIYNILMQALWGHSSYLMLSSYELLKHRELLEEKFDLDFGQREDVNLSYQQVYQQLNIALQFSFMSKKSGNKFLKQYEEDKKNYLLNISKEYDGWFDVFEKNPGLTGLSIAMMQNYGVETLQLLVSRLSDVKYAKKFSSLGALLIDGYPVDEEAGKKFAGILKNINSGQRLKVEITSPEDGEGIVIIAQEIVNLIKGNKINRMSKFKILYDADDVSDFDTKGKDRVTSLFASINCLECLDIEKHEESSECSAPSDEDEDEEDIN